MRTVRALIDGMLVVLATARLTRLVTEDHLGRWYVQEPAAAWADRHEFDVIGQASLAIEEAVARGEDPAAIVRMLETYDDASPWSWQKRLVEGLSCRWCVGFWIGVLILVSDVLTRTTVFGWARPVWRFAVAALGLNVVANWVLGRTDTT